MTPWEVLGMTTEATKDDDVTVADVKAAYRARMKIYHPDVYEGDGDGEAMARRIVAAYRAIIELVDDDEEAASVREWDGISETFPWARDDADPFRNPEGPADDVFVNPFNCRGKGGGCPSYCCCVERVPGSFSWSPETNAATFDGPTWTDLNRRIRQMAGDSKDPDKATANTTAAAAAAAAALEKEAYNLNLAVGQCPEMAIHWAGTYTHETFTPYLSAATRISYR